MELSVLLSQACPPHLKALAAPFDVVLDDQTGVQPDLLVAGRGAFTENNLPTAPLLAIEILSPSTRLVDLTLKQAANERAGVASYSVVDPVATRPLPGLVQSGVSEPEQGRVGGGESV